MQSDAWGENTQLQVNTENVDSFFADVVKDHTEGSAKTSTLMHKIYMV